MSKSPQPTITAPSRKPIPGFDFPVKKGERCRVTRFQEEDGELVRVTHFQDEEKSNR